jgi:hypothetical protein
MRFGCTWMPACGMMYFSYWWKMTKNGWVIKNKGAISGSD